MNATYISANTFSVTGDQSSDFNIGRRLKCDCGVDGIKYTTILSSSYSSVTTVIIEESVLTSKKIVRNRGGVYSRVACVE